MLKNADFEWYLSKSREINGPHRCPFAAANRCPRYYDSLYLLGKVGIATKVSPENKTKLDALWKDFEATIGEEAASISGGESNSTKAMSNFCPEVSYKIFGLFASGLFPCHGDSDRNMADSRLRRAGVKANDPRWHWADFTPAHYSECSEYSILQARVTTKKTENATDSMVFNIENVQGAVGNLTNSPIAVSKTEANQQHNLILAAEQARRENPLFEEQSRTLRTALELIYRSRNHARRIITLYQNQTLDRDSIDISSLRKNHDAIEEHLYGARGILPNDVFRILHQAMWQMTLFSGSVCDATGQRDIMGKIGRKEDMEKHYDMLDKLYNQVVAIVHEFLKIAPPAK